MPEDSNTAANALRLLWQPQAAARRGPKPTLTLDVITRAGIEIADTAGLATVTMQNVAAAVEVTKMALYRYVPGKTELIALMTEAAIGAAPRLDAMPGGWRPKLEAWARQLFDRFCRHPWALETTVGSQALGPLQLSWMEQALGALTDAGLRGGEMLDVAATLAGHARAISAQAAAGDEGSAERAMTGAMVELLRGNEERFPALVAALRSAVEAGEQDGALDFGLARILDGLALLIDERAAG